MPTTDDETTDDETTDDHMLRDLRRQAESMDGATALPTRDGEPVFDEPWQGRAVALAIETVAALELSWEQFRMRLIAAISDDPHRSYYASWLVALDDLATSFGLVTPADVDAHRMVAASYRTSDATSDGTSDGSSGDLDVFPVATDTETLVDLLTTVFGSDWWRSVRVDPHKRGADPGARPSTSPSLSMSDGYLTIDLGRSDLRLCVGPHQGASTARCAHAELQRRWHDGAPRAWMFRMYDGRGEPMATIRLPSPFVDDDDRAIAPPDWGRLALWDELRRRFLELPADPVDRTGDGATRP